MSAECYLGVGSNLGDRRQNIVDALLEIDRFCDLTAVSCLYETEPVGFKAQGYFLNAVVQVITQLQPQELLNALQQVEQKLGRKRTIQWGPRVIDLDMLTFGTQILNRAQLIIPHPQVPNRRFVLEPWAEIAPAFIVPGFNKTVSTLLNETVDNSAVGKILSASKLESLVKEG